MTTEVTLEVLAEKLGGKLWSKGGMKRVYLERGYNTKKMSTKTSIYQDENGDFNVSCYIDCPSQPFSWIKSQQQEVVESVEAEIEEAINPTEEVEEEVAEPIATPTTPAAVVAQPKTDPAPIVGAMGIGNKFQHATFGIGTVVEENEGLVSIDFPNIGVRKLIKKFVKLTPVA